MNQFLQLSPFLLFAIFVAYVELQERRSEVEFNVGQLYYLKNIPFKLRAVLYGMDVLFLAYSYWTRPAGLNQSVALPLDFLMMTVIACITLSAILSFTRVKIDKGGMKVGSTFIRKDQLLSYHFIPMNDKQFKFEFTFAVNKRNFTKPMFVSTQHKEAFEGALKRMKKEKDQ